MRRSAYDQSFEHGKDNGLSDRKLDAVSKRNLEAPMDWLHPEFKKLRDGANDTQIEFPGWPKSTVDATLDAIALEDSAAVAKLDDAALQLRDQIIDAAGADEIQFFAIYAADMIVKLMCRAREIPEMAECMGQFAYGTLLARRAVTVSNNGGDVRAAFGRHRLEKLGRLHEIASPAAVFAASPKRVSSSLGA